METNRPRVLMRIFKFFQSLTADNFIDDLSASLSVFLVAVPLCLGIAHASNAPLISGLLAGVFGGLVVGLLSNSHVSVSGPAAGLTAVMIDAGMGLGSFSKVQLAVVGAGLFQVLLGVVKFNRLVKYIPHSVIDGMLSGIGLIIIGKELTALIDHANGWALNGPEIIGIACLGLLLSLGKLPSKVPAALIVVLVGVCLNIIFSKFFPSFAGHQSDLVGLPLISAFTDIFSFLSFASFSSILDGQVLYYAVVIALVASTESLLCVEAADKIDPLKRKSNLERELYAQGTGNMVSGFAGGLPMTSVVIRTSMNVNSGAKSKRSAILHGLWILLALVFLAPYFNLIPLSALSAVLVFTGLRLNSIGRYKTAFNDSYLVFLPFVITVATVFFLGLLKGVFIGLILHFVMNAFIAKGLNSESM